MTDFTPGPWEFYGSRHVWQGDENDQKLIAVADDAYGEELSVANARLIAQAPALYEALEAASHCQYHSEQLKRQIDAVLAAARNRR
jgi:hypothetical protein